MRRIDFKSLLDLNDYFRTEKQCIEYFIKMRWNNKIKCPYKSCIANEFEVESNKIYLLKKHGSFKCSCCKKIFSYKVGTIFENSNITMKKWFMAIYLQLSNKKGITSTHLERYLKVRQATAWFMLQRLKYICNNNFFDISNEGTFEADEAYIGGREKNKHKSQKGKKGKAIVLGIINRDSKEAKAINVNNTRYYELGDKIMQVIKEGSNLITDESNSYTTLKTFYKHNTVNHSTGEYVRGKTHTNTIEGFWSLVKRTINGTHHWISEKHLQRYLSEMCFRYNTRGLTDVERFDLFLSNTKGRLKYLSLVGV